MSLHCSSPFWREIKIISGEREGLPATSNASMQSKGWLCEEKLSDLNQHHNNNLLYIIIVFNFNYFTGVC